MTRTYPFGYRGGRLTAEQMDKQPTWSKLDPEFRRRLLAAFDAAQDDGTSLGCGTGWRSSDTQRSGFLHRHTEVPAGQAHCCTYQGKSYRLRKGFAHMAPPGLSYHEDTTPDHCALAVDLVGNLKWFAANCDRFGLNEASKVNGEPWHSQPAELVRGRSRYRASMHPLHEWPIAPPPTVPYPGAPLNVGSIGASVKLVQRKVGATADGIYGPQTKRLVTNWQYGHGLTPDGTVDADDWASMFGVAA